MIQRLQRDDAPDAGFTLMEVLVALAIIAIVASASLAFFINGTRSVTTQQRQQNATSVANKAMEDAYSRVAKFSTTKTSGVVVGRTQAEVTAAWTAAVAAGVNGLVDAYPDWDAATAPAPLTGTADDAVPLTQQVTQSRIKYTVTTLFGSCYRSTTLASAPCTKTGGSAAWVASSGYQRMIRAAVMVTWADVTGNCGGTCSYNISSLIDPNQDLEWNNTTLILAADDSLSIDADAAPVDIDVLDNDTLPALTANPIASITQPLKPSTATPSMGTATINTGNGTIKFDPNDDAHGEVTFNYTLTIGARTATGTVHAYVNPLAVNYSSNAVVGVAGSVAVKTRYGTNPTSIAFVGTPPPGVTISGTTIKWTPTTAGDPTITYTYTDSEQMVSRPGTVSLHVTNYAPPVVGPLSISIPANSTDFALNLQTASGNASTYKVKVFGPASPSSSTSLKVDGNGASGTGTVGASATFSPQAKTLAVYTFTYAILDPDGNSSGTAVATVRAQPVAVADVVSAKKSPATGTAVKTDLDLGLNDGAYVGTTFTVVTAMPSGCGSLDLTTWATSGKVKYTSPTTAKSCNFSYKIVPTDTSYTTSNTVNVTLTVTN